MVYQIYIFMSFIKTGVNLPLTWVTLAYFGYLVMVIGLLTRIFIKFERLFLSTSA